MNTNSSMDINSNNELEERSDDQSDEQSDNEINHHDDYVKLVLELTNNQYALNVIHNKIKKLGDTDISGIRKNFTAALISLQNKININNTSLFFELLHELIDVHAKIAELDNNITHYSDSK